MADSIDNVAGTESQGAPSPAPQPTSAVNSASSETPRHENTIPESVLRDKLRKAKDAAAAEAERIAGERIAAFREEHGLDDAQLEKIKRAPSWEKKYGELEKQYRRLEDAHRDATVRAAVINAASGKATKPDRIWKLVKDDIGWDGKNLKPILPDGFDSVEEYVAKYLQENDDLALPVGGAGAGSRAAVTTSPTVTQVPSNGGPKTPEEMKAFFRANAKAFDR